MAMSYQELEKRYKQSLLSRDKDRSEFHERLKFSASKTVCDIPQTESAMLDMYDSYDVWQKRDLVKVLYKEIQQLLKVVAEAK